MVQRHIVAWSWQQVSNCDVQRRFPTFGVPFQAEKESENSSGARRNLNHARLSYDFVSRRGFLIRHRNAVLNTLPVRWSLRL